MRSFQSVPVPTREFIKRCARIPLIEEFSYAVIGAAVGFVLLVYGWDSIKPWALYAQGFEFLGNNEVELAISLTLMVVVRTILTGLARNRGGRRAIKILNLLATPGSRLSVSEGRYFIQPHEFRLTRSEYAVFKGTLTGEQDLIDIPVHLPLDFSGILKTFASLGLVVVIGYYLWGRYQRGDFNDAISVAQTLPIPGVRTLAAAPAPSITPVWKKPHNLAPTGVYYLIQRISITTDSGVISIPAGKKLIVKAEGEPLRVTDGENEFKVSHAYVTNDMDTLSQNQITRY